MDWYERGRSDYGEKVGRHCAPTPEGRVAGDEWRRGWDAAKAEDDGKESKVKTYETVPVRLEAIGGKIMLCDHAGRVIGQQVHLVIETSERGYVASVSFADLGLVLPGDIESLANRVK